MFFFNDTATTEIYTLSLHDALPICPDLLHDLDGAAGVRLDDLVPPRQERQGVQPFDGLVGVIDRDHPDAGRSEEHTSELQSRQYLGCRLLLEKKKTRFFNIRPCNGA